MTNQNQISEAKYFINETQKAEIIKFLELNKNNYIDSIASIKNLANFFSSLSPEQTTASAPTDGELKTEVN